MSEIIGIIGAGGMGRGIAEVIASAGYQTVLLKATPGDPEAARAQIAASYDRSVKKGKLSEADRDAAMGRLEVTSDIALLSRCSLVIESIVEDFETKQAFFKKIEPLISTDCIIASNTSSLPLGDLAGCLQNPSRFVGLHFFSPVPAMKLVEVAATARTKQETAAWSVAFVEKIGKTAVQVGETSGYIVNRLLVPYLLFAIETLEQRIASADAIDAAMKLGCAHPMGPLALSDAIGLDIVYAMAKTLHKELGDRRFSPPALLRRLVLAKQLGKKSRMGIYDYSQEVPCENPNLWPTEAGFVEA